MTQERSVSNLGNAPDLAIIIVSTNEAHWLTPCLRTVFAHAGSARLDVVVVDNDSSDGTRTLVEAEFPAARVVASENLGFGHANNQAVLTCSAPYLLFLNPDTEIVTGTFEELIAALDARPEVGLAGVRQVAPDGQLWMTIRRFPSITRALGEALGSERWPLAPSWCRERELEHARYDEEVECDWTSGSFMIARREALLSAGLFDERFFMYCDETDLCVRIKRAGWRVRHLPIMTIVHHEGKAGVRPKLIAQDVYSRRRFALKHFGAPYAAGYLGALGLRYLLRMAAPLGGRRDAAWRPASRLALSTLAGRTPPPFGSPPPTALPIEREDSRVDPAPPARSEVTRPPIDTPGFMSASLTGCPAVAPPRKAA